ncbi:MAG TPA: response regulator [Anaerolineaceae bacterium]|nr:response regulator [Anaerolineaceae bacterium]
MADASLSPTTVRVLVVEDDANNRLVITRLLKLAGVLSQNIYDTDGDALTLLNALPPDTIDLVFLDIQLPKKDGYTILQELRADPRYAGLQVVALTANVMRQDIERARTAGFDGFIGKPVDGRRFSQTLNRLLAGESVWTVL